MTSLYWGIKDTFVSYVRAMGGEVTLTAPASLAEDAPGDVFVFPLTEEGVSDDGARVFAFEGTVGFNAHGGLLSLTVQDPQIALTDERVLISVFDPTYNRRVLVATAEVAHDLTELSSPRQTVLADAGSYLFNNQYPSLTELSPFAVL